MLVVVTWCLVCLDNNAGPNKPDGTLAVNVSGFAWSIFFSGSFSFSFGLVLQGCVTLLSFVGVARLCDSSLLCGCCKAVCLFSPLWVLQGCVTLLSFVGVARQCVSSLLCGCCKAVWLFSPLWVLQGSVSLLSFVGVARMVFQGCASLLSFVCVARLWLFYSLCVLRGQLTINLMKIKLRPDFLVFVCL